MITRSRHLLSTAAIAAAALALAACGDRAVETETSAVSPPAADTTTTTAMATPQPGYTDPTVSGVTTDVPDAGATTTTTTPGSAPMTTPGATATTQGATSPAAGATGAASAAGAGVDASATASRFTDQQLQQFAQAVGNIRRQQGLGGGASAAGAADAGDPDVAIRQAGLTSEAYMQIAAAALTDEALRRRITQQPGWSSAAR